METQHLITPRRSQGEEYTGFWTGSRFTIKGHGNADDLLHVYMEPKLNQVHILIESTYNAQKIKLDPSQAVKFAIAICKVCGASKSFLEGFNRL
jgi:hypothetical protein